jgi:hypothetical protein
MCVRVLVCVCVCVCVCVFLICLDFFGDRPTAGLAQAKVATVGVIGLHAQGRTPGYAQLKTPFKHSQPVSAA